MSGTDAIRGMLLPIPTPFDGQGEIDEPMFRDLTQFYLEKGVNAFFVGGSYGQGPAMRQEQRKRAAEIVAEEVGGRVPLVIHIGTVDPYSAIDLGLHARQLGAAAVGIVGPYYYSDRSQDEVVLHFKMVDAAVQLPVFVYNNPAYQGYAITPPFMKRLVDEVPRIFGAKLAMGTLEQAKEYIRLIPGFAPFSLANGLWPGLKEGLRGTVSPPLTLAPEVGVDLIRAVDQGRDAEAAALQEKATEINDELLRLMKLYGRAPYAEGLRAIGFPIKEYPRWPTVEVGEADKQRLADMLKRLRAAAVA
jgi:dihydrodipicolinate synthase/N-acetylneuraminate lyase